MINEGTSLFEREGILTSAEDLVMFIEGPAGLGRSLGEVERALVASIYADTVESGADVDSIVDLLVSNFPESANLSDQGLPVPAMPGQMYAVDGGSMGFSSGYTGASKVNMPIKLAAPFIGDAPPPPWVKTKKPKKQRTERELKRSFEKATELGETSDLIDAYDLFLQGLQDFTKLFSFVEENRAIPDTEVHIEWNPESDTFDVTDPDTGEAYLSGRDFGTTQRALMTKLHQSGDATSELLKGIQESSGGELTTGGGSTLDPHYIQTRMQASVNALGATVPADIADKFSTLTDKIENYDAYVNLMDAFSSLAPNATAAMDLSNIDAVRNHAAAMGVADIVKPYLDFMTAWGVAQQFSENPEVSEMTGVQLDFSPDEGTLAISETGTGESLGSNLSFDEALIILTTGLDQSLSDSEAQILIQEATEMGTATSGASVQTHEMGALESAVSDAAGGNLDQNAYLIMQAIYYSDPNLLQIAEGRAETMHNELSATADPEGSPSSLNSLGTNLAKGIADDAENLRFTASNKLKAAMQKSQDMMTKIREEEAVPEEEEVARANRWPTNVPAWASSWNRIQRNMPVNVTLRATTFWPDAEGEKQAPSYKSPLFDLDPNASVVLDRGALSPQIAQEFSANNIRMSGDAIVEVEAPGRLWRLTDGPNAYIIERDDDGIRVSEQGKLQPPDLGKTPGTKKQSDKAFWDAWLKTTSDYFSWLLTPGTNPKGEPTQHQWGIGNLSSERGSGRYIADWLRQNAGYSDEDVANISPPLPKKRKRNLKKKDKDEPEFSDPFRPWSAY